MKFYTLFLFSVILVMTGSRVLASHIVGGEMTYKYVGDSIVYTNPVTKWPRYEITLVLYQDCMAGQPEAIAQDNPAFIGIYRGGLPYELVQADSMHYTSSSVVHTTIASPCGTIAATNSCVLKTTFVCRLALQPSATGYIINYQRCCRNSSIINITKPANTGVTFYCTIPPSGTADKNNSAQFKDYPPVAVAAGAQFNIDLSATDADGDSLSYELCGVTTGADENNIKPFPPGPPPFSIAVYSSGLSGTTPMHSTSALSIDPLTGMFSATPDQQGNYQLSICCNEWRSGVLINTVRREFQLKVSNSVPVEYKPDAGPDVLLSPNEPYQFNARDAVSYTWTPATYLSAPTVPDPVGRFPVAGVYTYTVHGVSANGCQGDDVITVRVIEHSGYAVPAAFTPNGDGDNDFLLSYPIGKSVLKWFKIYDRKGILVFDGGPGNIGWDGNYKGTVQDLGVYYWHLQFLDSEGKTRLIKGDVTLIR